MFSIGYFIEATLLSVALAMNCMTVSITCGLQKSLTKKRTLLMTFSFAFFQAFMPLIGSILSSLLSGFIEGISAWISFSILLVIGIKMFMDGKHFRLKDKVFDVSSLRVILLLSIATSIDALIVGIGFVGMGWKVGEQLLALCIIFFVTFLMSLLGVRMGEKIHFIKPRFALIIGGVILVAIGVKALVQFYLR